MRYPNPQETYDRIFAALGLGEATGFNIFLLIVVTVVILASMPYFIAKARGVSNDYALDAVRDVFIGVGCAMLVITFPGYFFFVGRAFMKALRAPAQ